MKRSNKGFTLIELIMVIVILGILAAVAVPKFYGFTTQAHDESKKAVIGNLQSAIRMYYANNLVAGGSGAYPAASTSLFDDLLEDGAPTSDWSVAANGTITYAGTTPSSTWSYNASSGKITAN